MKNKQMLSEEDALRAEAEALHRELNLDYEQTKKDAAAELAADHAATMKKKVEDMINAGSSDPAEQKIFDLAKPGFWGTGGTAQKGVEVAADFGRGVAVTGAKLMKGIYNGIGALAGLQKEELIKKDNDKVIPYIPYFDLSVKDIRQAEQTFDTAGHIGRISSAIGIPTTVALAAGTTTLAGAAAVDAAYGFVATDPDEGNLANALAEAGLEEVFVAGQVLEALDIDPDDTEIQARLKGALTDSMAGAAVASTINLIRGGLKLGGLFEKKKALKEVLSEAERTAPVTPKEEAALAESDESISKAITGGRSSVATPKPVAPMAEAPAAKSPEGAPTVEAPAPAPAAQAPEEVLKDVDFSTYKVDDNAKTGLDFPREFTAADELNMDETDKALLLTDLKSQDSINVSQARVLETLRNEQANRVLETFDDAARKAVNDQVGTQPELVSRYNEALDFIASGEFDKADEQAVVDYLKFFNDTVDEFSGGQVKKYLNEMVLRAEGNAVKEFGDIFKDVPAPQKTEMVKQEIKAASQDIKKMAGDPDAPLVTAKKSADGSTRVQVNTKRDGILGSIKRIFDKVSLKRYRDSIADSDMFNKAMEQLKDPKYAREFSKKIGNYRAEIDGPLSEYEKVQLAVVYSFQERQTAESIASALVDDSPENGIRIFREMRHQQTFDEIADGSASSTGAALRVEQLIGNLADLGDKVAQAIQGSKGRAALKRELIKKYGGIEKLQKMAETMQATAATLDDAKAAAKKSPKAAKAAGEKGPKAPKEPQIFPPKRPPSIPSEAAAEVAELRQFFKEYNAIAMMPDNQFRYYFGQVRKDSKLMGIEDALTRWFFRARLSSPATPMKAIISNGFTASHTVFEQYVQVVPAGIRGGLGAGKQQFIQANSFAYGFLKALKTSVRPAIKSFQDAPNVLDMNLDYAKGFSQTALNKKFEDATIDSFGSWMAQNGYWTTLGETPIRVLRTVDTYWNMTMEDAFYRGKAAVDAYSKGLSGDAANEHIAKYLQDIPMDVRKQGIDLARKTTMSRSLEGVLGAAEGVVSQTPGMRILVPFFKTNANLVLWTMKRGPQQLMFPKTWEKIARGGAEADEAISQIMAGTLTLSALTGLAHYGYIRGEQKDWRFSRSFEGMGEPPDTAVKVGDTWTSIKTLEPMSTMVNMAAILNKSVGYMSDEEYAEAVISAGAAVAESLTPDQYMQSLISVLGAHESSYEFKQMMVSLPSQAIPNVIADVEQVFDPTARMTQKGTPKEMNQWIEVMTNKMKARIPGLSTSLPPQRNIFGEIVEIPDGWGPDSISPFAGTSVATPESSVKMALEHLDELAVMYQDIGLEPLGISMPPNVISTPTGAYKLTPQEYDKYVKLYAGYDTEGKRSDVEPLYDQITRILKDNKLMAKDRPVLAPDVLEQIQIEIKAILNQSKRRADAAIKEVPSVVKAIDEQEKKRIQYNLRGK